MFTHVAKNRKVTASETQEPEAADRVMQTHHVHIGDQMPRSPSGLLDFSGINTLISPAPKLEEILLYSLFSRIFIFLLSHYYFHTCYR